MKTSMEWILELAKKHVMKQQSTLVGLSKKLHEEPELAFHEYKASEEIASIMETEGFVVERKTANIETALKAKACKGEEGPTIAFLAEYDALPEIGHACGHNIIAASSVGAALALKEMAGDTCGSIMLLGTPAEENGGGKILMIQGGAFDDVDFSLMMHPSNQSLIKRNSTACCELIIEFHGKPAHSSKPENGIDALYPLIQVFNRIEKQKSKYPPKVIVNGIITAGGSASNVIVDYSCGKFLIRANRKTEIQQIIDQIKSFATEEAGKNGSQVEFCHDEIYAERYSNGSMEEKFKAYMELQGEEMNIADPEEPAGSSDIGNLSDVMPIMHPYVGIVDAAVAPHTYEYAMASCSERADEVILKSAIALAAIGYELLTDEAFRNRVVKDFAYRSESS
ncbi:amidohydrolase [Tindallia magadiensis]|uniref:Peptidase M20 domain-containing protein 2 n=1 Tax=Tindallia magadiensis TaxID=69895 RepID=A0A1I3FDL9_9FIRM|nr:M20 family metallopeptidase [Tindallia magadiensis]SFI09254.1 amidohydrolase [Tindallia magadiensis]